MQNIMTSNVHLKAAAFVPGLPHILQPEKNVGYAALAGAMEKLGDEFKAEGVERIVYFSTQWISVLGHLYQAKSALKGLHVDENWYDIADLPFDFKVDRPFAEAMAKAAQAKGYQTKLVDYEGFPVDTGTIVADRLLNKGRFSTAMVSCCVYSDYADTLKLAGTIADTIAHDGKKTAAVAVSGLSGHWFTSEIDLREDHVRPPQQEWDKLILSLWEKGHMLASEERRGEYSAACKVDMGLKALSFLRGVGGAVEGKGASVRAYGGIYGTGAAVVRFR